MHFAVRAIPLPYFVVCMMSRFGHDNRTCGAGVGDCGHYQLRVADADSRRGYFTYNVRLLASTGFVPTLSRVDGSAGGYRGISVDGRGELLHVTVKGEHEKRVLQTACSAASRHHPFFQALVV